MPSDSMCAPNSALARAVAPRRRLFLRLGCLAILQNPRQVIGGRVSAAEDADNLLAGQGLADFQGRG